MFCCVETHAQRLHLIFTEIMYGYILNCTSEPTTQYILAPGIQVAYPHTVLTTHQHQFAKVFKLLLVWCFYDTTLWSSTPLYLSNTYSHKQCYTKVIFFLFFNLSSVFCCCCCHCHNIYTTINMLYINIKLSSTFSVI